MIVVFGSINVDFIARVTRLPHEGETLRAWSFLMAPGGKGANQAVGAVRAGADVHLFGCVGRDPLGEVALRVLRAEGVRLAGVRIGDASTGLALIHVDDAGENCITIVGGANTEACAKDVPDSLLGAGSTVVMQLELPLDEVAALAERAHRRGARVVLNAAPAIRLPAHLLDVVDVLVVNEGEAHTLVRELDDDSGTAREASKPTDARSLCLRLASLERAAIVTVGEQGAVHALRGKVHVQSAPRVEVVDTVGAGDAFTAALAAALDRGTDLSKAVRDGVAAGALACTRPGAQESMPSRDDIARMVSTLAMDERH